MDFLDPECAARSLGAANQMLTTFISTVIALHCNMSAPDKWPIGFGTRALVQTMPDQDYVVIGAGSAGSVVAARLAENSGDKVLLLEAGGNPPLDSEIPGLARSMLNSEIDWSYPTEPNQMSCLGFKNQSCTLNAGRVLGGSHSINGMVYLRGNSHDYDTWKEMGNREWGWEDNLSYFKKSERFRGKDIYGVHGRQGFLNVEAFKVPRDDRALISRAARELGYPHVDDFSAGKYLGFGKFYGTLRDGRRMTTARAFLTEKSNLYVMKHAVATKIIFDANMRATSVHFVFKDDTVMEVRAKKEIILSAGSIETPKLLMLSGIGPAAHLAEVGIPVLKDLRVGDNLQDHISVLLFLKLDKIESHMPEFEFLDSFFNQWVHAKGSLGSSSLDITGFLDTDSNGRYPDVQCLFASVPNVTEFAASFDEAIINSLEGQIDPSQRVIAISLVLLKPKSKGTVRLKSADYKDKPLIRPNYLHNHDDVNTLIRGIRKILHLEHAPSIQNWNGAFLKVDISPCDEFLYASERYWECYVKHMSSTIYHPVGTARMGPSNDTLAVVDDELNVRDVKGLRVIDASVMPTVVSANINPAVIMIAEKGADFVKRSWP